MSTRASILIKDGWSKQWMYRHSDGYPEGTMPSLKAFLARVVSGEIRDTVSQACGWLVLMGHEEYGKARSWKVGAYEPINMKTADSEYIYTVNLVKRTITCKDTSGNKVNLDGV